MGKVRDSLMRAVRGAVRQVVRPPSSVLHAATQHPWEVDGECLDPNAQYVLMLNNFRGVSLADMTPDKARRHYARVSTLVEARPPEVARTRAIELDTRSGPRPALVYYPKVEPGAGGTLPALVYFHGGGHTIGSIETHDGLCRRLCVEAECIVISVDYRLAPEQPFPAAVEDCYDAYVSVVERSAKLGIDSERLGVGGDSAGGNLAAVVAFLARDTGAQAPRLQLLIYPAVGGVEHAGRSNPALQEGYGLDAKTTRWFGHNYVSAAESREPQAAPLYLDSHAGLPPAIVAIAHFDLLRDEGLEYIEKLRAASVPVTELLYPDLPHGFGTMSLLPRAQEAISEIASALRKELRD